MLIKEPVLVLILADYFYRCSVRWRVAMDSYARARAHRVR